MAKLSLKNIKKSFGSTEVLKNISLDVEDGEFISLVGQSGCGKSTLLRIIAGLEAQDAGDILIDGAPMNGREPKDRNIAMVFQDYALYPHMSVGENMSMPLIMARLPMHARLPGIRHFTPAHRREKPGIDADVEKVAKQLRIEHLLQRKPAQLSGGQRQRVALGRALVRNPKVFLMDEPLSNLDAKLRVEVRSEITELHASSGLTFIYVTHDQTEAMTMSDRVALMQDGAFLQVGAPNDLYANPANIDVAKFIGSPEINMIKGAVTSDQVSIGNVALPIALDAPFNGAVQIGIRPEAITINGVPGLAFANQSERTIQMSFNKRLVEDLGPEVLIHGALAVEPNRSIRIRAQKSQNYGERELFASTSQLDVQIDPSSLLFFDPSGKRISSKLKIPTHNNPVELVGAA
ncbi:MAG: glycerol-3-phosphate ABC transporter ATP-binding protein [Hyphomicrobiales bacterium]|nr:MAG: glycerol-3-phosphate ABC transporter ATP-binding protein [Hyphomicrobiales bacterium]